MKLGDLVVVPERRLVKGPEDEWIEGKILIGEIASGPFIMDMAAPEHIELGGYVVRRINWLADLHEADLPTSFRAALRTQNPLIAWRAGALTPVIGAAHSNLIVDGEFHARFITGKPDFSTLESFHFNAFALAVVAALKRVQADEGPLDPGTTIYDLAASVGLGDELVPAQEASIHSLGYATLRGTLHATAVIAILFQLAITAEAEPFSEPDHSHVTVVNSKSEDFDPCAVGIDESVRATLNMMGYDIWQEACNSGRLSHENDGLQSPTTRVRIFDNPRAQR